MASVNIKHIPTSTYHPQTSGSIERYRNTLVARLRHYVAQHHRNWDAFILVLTYVYSAQVQRSTKCTQMELFTSRQPSGSLPFSSMRTKDDQLDAEYFKTNCSPTYVSS